jgi:hypothetical protein
MKRKLMRLIAIIFVTSIFIAMIESISIAYAEECELFFWVGGLRIQLLYPEECHKGDTITYKIEIHSSGYSEGNFVEIFNVSIRYLQYGTPPYLIPIILYSETLYKNMVMPYGNDYKITIQVTIPKQDIPTDYHVRVVFDIETYRNGHPEDYAWTNLVLHTTKVVWETREELLNENLNLHLNYTQLQRDYESLNYSYELYKQTHKYSNSEYEDLNSAYNQYRQGHSHSNTEYNSLITELEFARSLNYALIVTTIVFLATTVYLVIRKLKVKPKTETK